MLKKFKTRVIIVGGGLAGLTLSCLLSKYGVEAVCLDQAPPPSQAKSKDTRTTAISWGSHQLLKAAGIWDEIESVACPIHDIRILDGSSPDLLSFLSKDVEGRAFGWIVDNADLKDILEKTLAEQNIVTVLNNEKVTALTQDESGVSVETDNELLVEGELLIAVDGRKSSIREMLEIEFWQHDYQQTALVTIARHEKPHQNTAVEHFRPEGPFAMLPFIDDQDGQHQSAIVWTVKGKDAGTWLAAGDDIIALALQERSRGVFGKIQPSQKLAGWPLNIVKSYTYTQGRCVLAAEAAHGIHPIAGQGLNMSLRDVALLVELIVAAKDKDLGAHGLPEAYQSSRHKDNLSMAVATHGLNKLFESRNPVIKAARRAGITGVQKVPMFKKFFMKQAMGDVGVLPELIKTGKLKG